MSVMVIETFDLSCHRLCIANDGEDAGVPLIFREVNEDARILIGGEDGGDKVLTLSDLLAQLPLGQAGRWRITVEFERREMVER